MEEKIFMKDLWPLNKDVHKLMDEVLKKRYLKKIMKKFLAVIQIGKKIKTTKSSTYKWSLTSTYIKTPIFRKKI